MSSDKAKILDCGPDGTHVVVRRTPHKPGDLVGAAEAADILGVERTRISRYRRTGAMPDPISELRATPVWHRRDVENLRNQRKRKAAARAAGRR
jgi:hypothetical protein